MSIAEVAARCAAAALVVVAFAACTSAPGDAAPAASTSVRATLPEPPATEFDPGHIVSDDAFYDSRAMDEDQIQAFLESVSCRADAGVKCLADYTQTTTTQPAVGGGHCEEYRGGIRERASRIIAKAAVACGVSPRTLLVLLQKEQSLLSRPSVSGYERATGYGCPDTADCDAKYFGFFNQVYNAAWQFRQYTEEPDRQYRIGVVNVGYHPDAACGASPVEIRNQATANLYNYTPYQPSAVTLADPDTGDGCSAFGNLNFWRIWHRWFGDPEAERLPGFFPPCSRLVGGHPCPVQPTIPAAALG
ncbi:hypothetical protein [Agromyces sp. Soil535]|uniref:hypothetical protein n=1 Tax=Agromyces sp. Soil535 TaxID=1736390 RepID=UPI0006F69BEC|nr:hypothetical protein [Agromyces sp. Soil535]KRE26165.1 hypothetical protein ASG80_05035 [Agromyces sp. Soil535]